MELTAEVTKVIDSRTAKVQLVRVVLDLKHKK